MNKKKRHLCDLTLDYFMLILHEIRAVFFRTKISLAASLPVYRTSTDLQHNTTALTARTRAILWPRRSARSAQGGAGTPRAQRSRRAPWRPPRAPAAKRAPLLQPRFPPRHQRGTFPPATVSSIVCLYF